MLACWRSARKKVRSMTNSSELMANIETTSSATASETPIAVMAERRGRRVMLRREMMLICESARVRPRRSMRPWR